MTDGKDGGNNGDTPIPGETPPNDAEQMQENVDLAQTIADQLAEIGVDTSEIQENLDAAQEHLDNAAGDAGKADDNGGSDGGGDDWNPY
jgi:ABC-type transport system substrate-binding protein